MPVDMERVREAASKARPKVIAIRTGKTGVDGQELFVHLVQEHGEPLGEVLTRALKNGSITSDMIPESVQGKGAGYVPPGSDLGPFESALLSTGATQLDIGRGLSAMFTDRTLQDNAVAAQNEDPARQGISTSNPKSSLTGTLAGSFVPVPGGPLAQTAAGVVQGAAERAGRGEETTPTNALLDAGISVLPGTLTHRMTRSGPGSNPLRQQVDLLEGKGVPLSPAERSHGRILGAAERAIDPALESTFTGRMISSVRRGQQNKVINREASRAFGTELDNLGGDALDGVARDLGAQFDNILGDTGIGSLRLTQAVNDAKSEFMSGVVRPDKKVFGIADRVTEKFPDGMSGSQYSGGVRSELLAESRSLWKDPRNHKNAQAIDALISRLDEAFGEAGGNTGAYQELRHKWNMLRIIRPTVDPQGNVSARKLANAFKREGILGEAQRFADAAATITKPLVGNSGTADRILGADFLGNLATGQLLDPRNVVNVVPPMIEFVNSGSTAQSVGAAFGRGMGLLADNIAELEAESGRQGLLGRPVDKAVQSYRESRQHQEATRDKWVRGERLGGAQ